MTRRERPGKDLSFTSLDGYVGQMLAIAVFQEAMMFNYIMTFKQKRNTSGEYAL